MRHTLGLAIAFLVALAAGMALQTTTAGPAAPARTAQDSPCVVESTKLASPDAVLLGETVSVTLRAVVTCTGQANPLHVALVLDGVSSVAGAVDRGLQSAAMQFALDLDLPGHPERKVAVVAVVGSEARLLTPLTNDLGAVTTAIRTLPPGRGARLDLGLAAGIDALVADRTDPAVAAASEVLIVGSDASAVADCAPVAAQASRARGLEILMMAICPGPNCIEACMRQVAAEPRFYHRVNQPGGLATAFGAIRNQLLSSQVRGLQVTDRLSPDVTYVAGSAAPPPSAPAVPDRWLRWDTPWPPPAGVTFTLAVTPNQAGAVTTNLEATGVLTDHAGRTLAWSFPLPSVIVLAPGATPTVGPTPTPTTVPTTPPTPAPPPAYLPWAERP